MPMRRTIGMFLACLVTSACALGEAPGEITPQDPGGTTLVSQGNAEGPIADSRSFPCGAAQEFRSAEDGLTRVEQRLADFELVADNQRSIVESYCSPISAVGIRLVGKAAWYNLLGHQTASGEFLDTVTPTAAHRWLPLASFAKVTNLDNGRSVILKINDRGPYTRGRILDVSPRAADALDMKRAGVVAVVIEPLLPPTVANVGSF
jgi:rare lipoprotein A